MYAVPLHPQGYHRSRWSLERNARIVRGAERQKLFHDLLAEGVVTEMPHPEQLVRINKENSQINIMLRAEMRRKLKRD